MGTTATLDAPALLDLEGEKYNPTWVDEKQPLFVPTSPLHWKAHKLQILLDRLDKMAANVKGLHSFNAASYLQILNEYTKTVSEIKKGETDQDENNLDGGELEKSNAGQEDAPAVREGITPSLGIGISAENPLAG